MVQPPGRLPPMVIWPGASVPSPLMPAHPGKALAHTRSPPPAPPAPPIPPALLDPPAPPVAPWPPLPAEVALDDALDPPCPPVPPLVWGWQPMTTTKGIVHGKNIDVRMMPSRLVKGFMAGDAELLHGIAHHCT